MAGSLHSTSWYRVAGLRPQLREHARLYRHHYRGQRWYVLQDPASGRCHRLSPTAHHLIGLMDGGRTAQEIWDTCLEVLGDDAPTQDETIRLLGLLYQADVLRCDVTPDLG
jgi:putative peptide zinc metalloprotease protein